MITRTSFFPAKNKKTAEKKEEVTRFEYNFENNADTELEPTVEGEGNGEEI